MAQSSYDVSSEELVNRVLRAVAEAGASNSGLCIDPAAGLHRANAAYFKGVLLARLDGVKPPYQSGNRVEVISEGRVSADHYRDPSIGPGTYTVSRMWYSKKKWLLELKGVSGGDEGTYFPLYPAEAFKPVPALATTT